MLSVVARCKARPLTAKSQPICLTKVLSISRFNSPSPLSKTIKFFYLPCVRVPSPLPTRFFVGLSYIARVGDHIVRPSYNSTSRLPPTPVYSYHILSTGVYREHTPSHVRANSYIIDSLHHIFFIRQLS